MRKSLSYRVLLSVLALSTINYASPENVLAGVDEYPNYNVTYDGENVNGNYKTVYGNEHSFTFEGEAIGIFGSYNNSSSDTLSNINITVNNSNVSDNVFGVLSETNSNSTITNNHVTINSSKDLDIVCGASSSGGKVTNNYVTINDSEVSYEVCGGVSTNGEVSNNYVIINESTINNINKNTVVRGGTSNTGNVFGNHVTINGGTLNSVQGGFSHKGNVNDNHVTISNATITGSIVGGYNGDNQTAEIQNNSITIKGTTNISKASLHGYATNQSAANIKADKNRLILDSWSGTVNSIHNFDIIEFKNINSNTGLTAYSIGGMNDTQIVLSSIDVTNLGNATNHIFGTITLNENITNVIKDFTNKIDTADLNGWNFNDNETNGIYAGYSESGSASSNTIIVAADTNAAKMTLSGSNTGSSQNTLNVTGNGSTFNNIEDFDTINFNGIKLNGADVLTLQSANLNGTTLNVESLEGGNNYNAGDTVTLIKSADAITGTSDGINIDNYIVTAGVARDLEISTGLNADGKSIDMYVEDVSMNDQITLVAENRAVAAAFVNQGTDLINDSLDTISRDDNYGVKTFATVHGNRSKYDVNSDIKINGWSTIVGVGNADKFDNGSEFSWGVFYENGSGNYRTYNEFNNEFFRDDGSLVYNGGGIAARYTNKNGVYTEGSLRAGMLKSDMDNALRDGAGNFYGYES